MSTFEVKMTILTILGEAGNVALAEEMYQWVMEEVEREEQKKADIHSIN